MTEDQARDWVAGLYNGVIADRLATFAKMVEEENRRQNLISSGTVSAIWSRHIVDSLQLLSLAREQGDWIDVGTGGGFPGLVVGIAECRPLTLVEPRRKRAEFLQHSVERLGLPWVRVAACKVEQLQATATTISARAVAPVESVLLAARHCATPQTQWLLPRGTVHRAELTDIAARHGLMFHVEHSLTQSESSIVILSSR